MKQIDVTIALVHYKTPELLLTCLRSINQYTKIVNYEIIVADNNSNDNSKQLVAKYFPKVKFISNKKNLYATGGNNQIYKLSKGNYFLVLNPDIEFFDDAIGKMKVFLDNNPNVAAVSCGQYSKDENLHKVCSRFCTPLIEFWQNNLVGRYFQNKKAINRYLYSNWDRTTTKKVDVISDTIMLIRSSVASELGLYDERLKLLYMENDLCMRIKKLDYSVYYLGSVKVKHHIGQSTKTLSPWEFYKIFDNDMLYYYSKYFNKVWVFFLWSTFKINKIYFLMNNLIYKFKKSSD